MLSSLKTTSFSRDATAIVVILAAIATAGAAHAQRSGYSYRAAPSGSYYSPRVVQAPQPYGNRGAYQTFGGLAAGSAAIPLTGNNPWASLYGYEAGKQAGNYMYNQMGSTRYYTAPYQSVQTTTPYMVRPGPY
jgi:hypothetical protein